MARCRLNQVDVKVKMYRNPVNFALLAKDVTVDFKIDIEDIYIPVKKIRVNPAGHRCWINIMHCLLLLEQNVDPKASLRAASPSTGKICFKGGNRKRLVKSKA